MRNLRNATCGTRNRATRQMPWRLCSGYAERGTQKIPPNGFPDPMRTTPAACGVPLSRSAAGCMAPRTAATEYGVQNTGTRSSKRVLVLPFGVKLCYKGWLQCHAEESAECGVHNACPRHTEEGVAECCGGRLRSAECSSLAHVLARQRGLRPAELSAMLQGRSCTSAARVAFGVQIAACGLRVARPCPNARYSNKYIGISRYLEVYK